MVIQHVYPQSHYSMQLTNVLSGFQDLLSNSILFHFARSVLPHGEKVPL